MGTSTCPLFDLPTAATQIPPGWRGWKVTSASKNEFISPAAAKSAFIVGQPHLLQSGKNINTVVYVDFVCEVALAAAI